MIRVGEIREREGFKFVISKIYGTSFGDRAFIVYDDGYTESIEAKFLENNSTLIAEYPTWQEAVNSKEFKND